MKTTKTLWTLVLALLLTSGVSAPAAVHASAASRQGNKNTWRNLGYGAAGIAGYGLLKHNTAATLLGAAGAAYSAHRYEQDRHSQDQARRAHTRYRRRGRPYYHRGRKYYRYDGHLYSMDLKTGSRHRVD